MTSKRKCCERVKGIQKVIKWNRGFVETILIPRSWLGYIGSFLFWWRVITIFTLRSVPKDLWSGVTENQIEIFRQIVKGFGCIFISTRITSKNIIRIVSLLEIGPSWLQHYLKDRIWRQNFIYRIYG